jgi:hypothetical protein
MGLCCLLESEEGTSTKPDVVTVALGDLTYETTKWKLRDN